MSASICWEKISKKEPKTIGVMAPSHFMSTCQKVFGQFPVELGEKDMERLKTIMAMDNEEGWGDVVSLIEKYGSIKLWAEY